MRSKLDKYLVVLTVIGLVLANTTLGLAEDQAKTLAEDRAKNRTEDRIGNLAENQMESFRLTTEPEQEPQPEPGSGAEATTPESPSTADQPSTTPESPSTTPDPTSNTDQPKQDQFLDRVKQELNLTKADYHQLLNSVAETKKRLELVSEEKLSLQEQLTNLEDQITVTKDKLLTVIRQIIEKENEMTLLYEQIEMREVALTYQKNLLKDYVRLIYQEENAFLTINKDGSIEAFKLLLADGNVGETLRKLHYFDLLNETGQQMVDKLDRLSKELEGQKTELNTKKAKLEELKEELTLEKDQLELQKESKQQLLRITMGQEEIYQQLLEQTAEEQEQLINDIKNLGNALTFIENKIIEEGENFDPDKYLALLDYRTQVLYNFQIQNFGLGIDGFIWPVDPDRGISAYFRDPGYVGTFGVQHNAVDIPEYQGSVVRAPADGVVYTARDNGYGYSYIILAHAGGIMTVYGHVSSILVEEGQTITQGSIIALSGGMPGTKGSGYMTTGPHLHFEMLQNGLYVDPLEHLPLEVLTEEQAQNLPEKYQDDWETAVLKEELEPVVR